MYPTRTLRAYRPHGEHANITGFDIRDFREAATQKRYDPWERAEAWRYQGQFTRWNRFRRGFPGLGIATAAFAAYCTYEYFFLNDSHGHHQAEGHGETHH